MAVASIRVAIAPGTGTQVGVGFGAARLEAAVGAAISIALQRASTGGTLRRRAPALSYRSVGAGSGIAGAILRLTDSCRSSRSDVMTRGHRALRLVARGAASSLHLAARFHGCALCSRSGGTRR